MQKKFHFTLIALAALFGLLLTACVAAEEAPPSEVEQPAVEGVAEETQAEEVDAAPEPVTITFWHQWTGGWVKDTVDELVEQYMAENPHVTIVQDAVENEAYKLKLQSALAAGEVPDIWFGWAAGSSQPFVEAGLAEPLDAQLAAVEDRLLPVLAPLSYDGKAYAVPYGMSVAALYANEELFAQNNVEIPETWDELKAAVDTFNAAGITPITIGMLDKWPAGFWHAYLAYRTGGVEMTEAAWAGGPADTPELLAAAAYFAELAEAGAFNDGAIALGYDEAEAVFKNGQAAMYLQGSWAAGSVEADDSLVKGKVVVAPFPTIDGGMGNDVVVGGCSDGLFISSNSAVKDAAIDFAMWFGENYAAEGYKEGILIPTWKVDVDETEVLPLFLEIQKMAEAGSEISMWWDTILGGERAENYKDLLAGLFAGQISPEEFNSQMPVAIAP